ncbi:hypothetical protein D3C73_1561260 [compost metagenome]
MQFEIGAAVGQAFGHAENGGNADTAGEEQAAPGFMAQWKQVARLTDCQMRAGMDLLVHGQ